MLRRATILSIAIATIAVASNYVWNRVSSARAKASALQARQARMDSVLSELQNYAGESEIIRLIIKLGGDLDWRCEDCMGETLLHMAALHGDIEGAQFLLQHGADPNSTTVARGNTPLHYAVMGDQPGVTLVLLQGGANPEAPDRQGITPLQSARGNGSYDVARVMSEWLRGSRTLPESPNP